MWKKWIFMEIHNKRRIVCWGVVYIVHTHTHQPLSIKLKYHFGLRVQNAFAKILWAHTNIHTYTIQLLTSDTRRNVHLSLSQQYNTHLVCCKSGQHWFFLSFLHTSISCSWKRDICRLMDSTKLTHLLMRFI